MESLPFKCEVIPGVPTATGRIFSAIHMNQMIDYIDQKVTIPDNKKDAKYVMVASTSSLRESASLCVDLRLVKGVIEKGELSENGELTVYIQPIVDDTIELLYDFLELKTVFIGNVSDGFMVTKDSEFAYFYLTTKPGIKITDLTFEQLSRIVNNNLKDIFKNEDH